MNDMAPENLMALSASASRAPGMRLVPVDHDPFAGPALSAFTPVTASQSEIWLACALDAPMSLAYNEGLSLQLRGALDVQALEAALQRIVDRHESLRASFSPDGRWMCVHESLPVSLPLTALEDERDPQAAFDEAAQRGMREHFDLERGPLIRFALYRLSAQEHRLVLVAHHLVCDGWSMAQLLVEIGAIYSALVERRDAELPYAPDRYVEYSRLERVFAASEEGQRQLRYWVEQLREAPAALDLPSARPRPAQRRFEAARYDHRLPAELAAELRRFGAAHGSSLVMTLLAGFTAHLHRLTGADDMVIGLAAAGQSLHERPHLVGHCVNLLPLRLKPAPQLSFGELLDQTRRVVLDAYENQGATFGAILPQLQLPEDASRPKLISIGFNLDVRDDDITHSGLQVRYETLQRACDNFELALNIVDNGHDLVIECTYNRALFDEDDVRRRVYEYENLLRQAEACLQTPLRELPLISQAERTRLLEDFNATAPVELPRASLHALIAAQAARRPDAIALADAQRHWSYAQMMRRADAIAAALQAHGVVAGDFVGVSLRRTIELPAALLGVLKCGAAYVPLDAELPAARLDFMARDAQLRLLLCERATSEAVATLGCAKLTLEDVADYDGEPIETTVEADAPAYAIYTSGSTGQPKGVVVPHRGVVNCMAGTQSRIGIGERDTLLSVTTFAFDGSVIEFFLPLLHGASLAIADEAAMTDGQQLAAALERFEVTRLLTVPAIWRLLLAAGWQGKSDLIGSSAAEPLTPDLAAALLPRLAELWNLYGPTESTVWMLGTRIVDAQAPITIGSPIANTRAYVLDAQRQPVPVGVSGELYIGGAGVALGYLNRPKLDAERFLPDPFVADCGASARMYRTGDVVRWTEHGEIVFQGRADHQVKLRGYRIELGEIEAALKLDDDIADAVCGVLERSPGDPRLVAWVQPANALQPHASALRRSLREQLPAYMIPQHFVMLEALPRLPNGKLDRKRLPSPFETRASVEVLPTAPRSVAERDVATLWQELLGHDNFHVTDRFLDVGGHSLLAVQLAARLRERFALELPLREVLAAPLGQIALALEACRPARPDPTASDETAVAPASAPATTSAHAAPPTRSRLKTLWERLTR